MRGADSVKCGPEKGGLITKTINRCRSARDDNRSPNTRRIQMLMNPKSWMQPRAKKEDVDGGKRPSGKRQVAPEGCFSVYVGPERQKFVIRTELANHPLFKLLLEEAESEYGFNSGGPLVLPCHVDLFNKVLVEMDCKDDICPSPLGCSAFPRSRSSYQLLSPSRLVAMNNNYY